MKLNASKTVNKTSTMFIYRLFLLQLVYFPLCFPVFSQQGLEAVEVEKIPVSAAAIANDPNLSPNAITYRVFVDLASDFEMQAVFALATHEMKISTTTAFYNNADFGGTSGKEILSSLVASYPALAYDSYITVNSAANNKLGILLIEDTEDDSTDGLINGTALALQTIGDDFSVPFGTEMYNGVFSTFSGIYNVNGGEQGPTESNKILIGQFTTDGQFSFELNLQIRKTNTSLIERYVSKNPSGSEYLWPQLVYPGNLPPVVSITNPQPDEVFATGEEVEITAEASDEDGIAYVKFLINADSVGIDSTSPYQTIWTSVEGDALIRAVAMDSTGLADSSQTVSIEIKTFVHPEINISDPQNGTLVLLNQSVTIVANATDSDGSITLVEFFVNNVKIGEDNTSPYSINWTALTIGQTNIYARAVDNDGLNTSSSVISITVNPITSVNDQTLSEAVTLYPNPANEYLRIQFVDLANKDQAVDASIIDLHGITLINKRFTTSNGLLVLDLHELPKGSYFVRLTLVQNKHKFYRQFIKN